MSEKGNQRLNIDAMYLDLVLFSWPLWLRVHFKYAYKFLKLKGS